MTKFLLVGLGGAAGSMARYGVGLVAQRLAPGAVWPSAHWPWATLTVNLVGGLLMGLLIGWLAQRGGAGQETVRLFGAVGLLGGFTTFSAFSLEVVLMIERRQFGLAAAYVAVSVGVAVAALMVGLLVARRVFGAAV